MPDYAAACEAAIAKALKGAISVEELHDEMLAISDAIEIARAKGEDVHSAAGRLSNDLVRSAERSAMIQKRNAYKSRLIERDMMDHIERAYTKFGGKKDSLYMGLKSIIVGMNTEIGGAQRSAAAMEKGLHDEYLGALFSRLRKAGLLPTFQHGMKGDFELQVAAAIRHLNTKDAAGETPRIGNLGSRSYQDAVAIAKIIVDLQEALRLRVNRAGADVVKLSGFIGHQAHNDGKMLRAGFDKWSESIRGKLDWDKMRVAPDRRERFLKDAYEAIVTGVRKDPTKGRQPLAEGFKGSSNLARSISHSRLFHFKDAGDWLAYNKQFGSGTLRESLISDITMSTKNIGVMERLTTNPESFIDGAINKLAEKYRSDVAATNYLKNNKKFLENDLAVVTGAANIGSETRIAKVGESWRAWKTMSTLGGSFISALSDIAFGATNRIYQGRSLMQAWGDGFVAPLMQMGSAERKAVAELLGAGLEMQTGAMISRFSAEDLPTGTLSKMMHHYFKLNLLGPWTDSVKAGHTLMISHDFASTASKSFDKLKPEHSRLLNLYGINAKQWDVIRQAAKVAEDGRTYIMPGDIMDVEGAVFTGMSRLQQQRLKEQAKENLFMLYSSEADFAAPTPGAREQSILKAGTTPNSVLGQALRMATQFKAFSVTALTKPFGRALQAGGGGANLQMANLIAGSILMGTMIAQLKELSKGREPLAWDDPQTFIRGAMQGGALGIYGDFLLQKHNEYGGSLASTAVGPIPNDLMVVLNAAQDVGLGGDFSNLGRAGVNLLKGNTPGANLFYTKMAMDYLIFYQLQEFVNPGYVTRMERNLKNRTGQEYMSLPIFGTPSQTIATGGGFK